MRKRLSKEKKGISRRDVGSALVSTAVAATVIGSESKATRAAVRGVDQTVAVSGLKCAIVGATSRTADQLIPQALGLGHEVIALARRPHAVKFEHPRLKVMKSDVYDQASIEAALTGDEVVVSVYGPRTDPENEIPVSDLMTQGTKNIMAAMRKKGNQKLFATSSTGVQGVDLIPDKKPQNMSLAQMWMWNQRGVYRDFREMEDVVHAGGLDSIVLRPSFLLEQPPQGNVRLSVDEDAPLQRLITYADFALFILGQFASDAYVGQTVGVYGDTSINWGTTIDFEEEREKLRQKRLEVEADLRGE